jgi:hypothetical protein
MDFVEKTHLLLDWNSNLTAAKSRPSKGQTRFIEKKNSHHAQQLKFAALPSKFRITCLFTSIPLEVIST